MTGRAEIVLTGTTYCTIIDRPMEIHDRSDKDITIMFLANPCNVALSHSHGFDKIYKNCGDDNIQAAIEDAKSGFSTLLITENIDFQKIAIANQARVRTGRGAS